VILLLLSGSMFAAAAEGVVVFEVLDGAATAGMAAKAAVAMVCSVDGREKGVFYCRRKPPLES
jgi:hypothetical protein